MGLSHWDRSPSMIAMPKTKQANVDEHADKTVVQVGLLIDEPPGCAEMPFA
jgi:hypothetical protein